MKKFEIFRPGKHIASNGLALTFSEADLKAAVAAYDPKIHEAPITVGHPVDNRPAYGWIKGLDFTDSSLHADPDQVEAQFEEMVAAGRFKKRSASFYLPKSANHPLKDKPGHDAHYLRHVAFLGAQPPAVKGLKDVTFKDAEEGVVEFSDEDDETLFARLWAWLKGNPEFREATKPATRSTTEDDAMTPEQTAEMEALKVKAAKVDALTAQVTELTGKVASFAEREDAVKKHEGEVKRAKVATAVEDLVKAGKVLPSAKQAAIDFAMTLDDGTATIDFREGDKTEKVNQRDYYLRGLAKGPKVIEFQERSKPEGNKLPLSTEEDMKLVSEKAREYVDEQAKKGIAVSFTDAVRHVATVETITG